MSGGYAYVLDESGHFETRCNVEMVELEELSTEDATFVAQLLEEHVHYTGSERAKQLLADWEQTLSKFVKVVPVEYRRVLEAMAQTDQQISARRDSLSVVKQPQPLDRGATN
jgi:glutamate synthase (NADPH/NADH) large chain